MSHHFNINSFISRLPGILSIQEFNGLAIELFQYQAKENKVYANYLYHLGVNTNSIDDHRQIPFLPITFFKSHKVLCEGAMEEKVFTSSGTTGMQASKHYIADLSLYHQCATDGFKHFYGDPNNYIFLGLLPSYLERSGSSLIFMVQSFMEAGGHAESGFYLDEYEKLAETLTRLSEADKPAILIGVSFALLDFVANHKIFLGDHIRVIETGGMKGRREEITREELHHELCRGFNTENIHSEYGMTELLSQAYAKKDGRFQTPPWMKVLIRDIQDPFTLVPEGKSGAINIIDLANIHSCAFIETQDIGRMHADSFFEVLGRTDVSDIRGCSLMIT